jgi:hypothetical protein
MSIFPTGAPGSTWRNANGGGEAGLEADGVLVRPISGQIYLIEEDEPAAGSDERQPPMSGLVSRH